MNSFVQALFMTKEFRYRILCLSLSELGQTKNDMDQLQESKADPHYLASRKKLVAMFQLQKVFALLMTAQRPAINPQFFKASLPDFFKNSFAQQDSSEFGKVYLDEIEKSIKDTNEKVNSISSNLNQQDYRILLANYSLVSLPVQLCARIVKIGPRSTKTSLI